MAVEEVVGEVVSVLPPQIANNVGVLVKIFQAVGIAVLIYLIYLVTIGFITYRRMKRVQRIEEKLEVIDKKLNKLLKGKKK